MGRTEEAVAPPAVGRYEDVRAAAEILKGVCAFIRASTCSVAPHGAQTTSQALIIAPSALLPPEAHLAADVRSCTPGLLQPAGARWLPRRSIGWPRWEVCPGAG